MKNVFLFVFLIYCASYSQTIRYVTPTGGGDGTSVSNAWSLATAISSATAGTTVYVQRGTYNIGNGLTQSNNGTAANPIRFIGYNNTPNDIVSEEYSSWSYGQSLPLSTLPLIQGTSETTGFGITVNGDYVEFSNLQITDFITANTWNGDYGKVDNVIYFELGGQTGNPTGSGNALPMNGQYIEVNNSACYNVGSTCFTANNANNVVRNSWGGGDNNGQYMGYIFSAIGDNADNNLFENCRIERRTEDSGEPYHGFIVKNGGNNNVFRNCYALSAGIEASYKNSTNNLWENIILEGFADRTTDYAARIFIVNGSNNNTFRNIIVRDNAFGVEFRDYDDGTSSDPERDAPEGGSNNTFINVVIENVDRFIYFTDAQGTADALSADNMFINCTFTGGSSNRFLSKISTIQVNGLDFINCTWKDIENTSGWTDNGTIGYSNIVLNYVNFDNVTNGPTAGATTTISNLTNIGFSFVDPSTNDYGITTNVLDIGTDPTVFDIGAATDFEGTTRTAPYTLGAFEFEGGANSTTAARKRAFYINYFDN